MKNIEKRNEILDRKRVLAEEELSTTNGVSYQLPIGGFYYWLKLRDGLNAEQVFHDLIKQKVFLIPGDVYFWKKKLYNAFRLSVSYVEEERIRDGLRKIKEVMETYD